MTRTSFLTLSFIAGVAGICCTAGASSGEPSAAPAGANPVIEIRTYKLKEGSLDEFDRMVRERSMPLLARWNVDVVAFGPSVDGEDTYVLIRAFDSLKAREAEEAAFYASEDWRNGPREAILALIEDYTSVVLSADKLPDAAKREIDEP